jgi:nitrate reductase molybdenum cofactor assembly chaperone NarJ/NarW
MARTFKVLSALLSYPAEELQEAAEELRAALLDEALLPEATQADVDRLIADFAASDLYGLQERYVELFDRGRSLFARHDIALDPKIVRDRRPAGVVRPLPAE